MVHQFLFSYEVQKQSEYTNLLHLPKITFHKYMYNITLFSRPPLNDLNTSWIENTIVGVLMKCLNWKVFMWWSYMYDDWFTLSPIPAELDDALSPEDVPEHRLQETPGSLHIREREPGILRIRVTFLLHSFRTGGDQVSDFTVRSY